MEKGFKSLDYYRIDDLLTEEERMARDVLGAAGITCEFQSGRHLVTLEPVYTYEGTHDIHALTIGADLTGIEAFR